MKGVAGIEVVSSTCGAGGASVDLENIEKNEGIF